MERKIGEVFELDGVKLRVEEGLYLCDGCCLYDIDIECTDFRNIRGDCSGFHRTDKTDVIFTEVKE